MNSARLFNSHYKGFFTLLLLLVSIINSQGQVVFEKGYFIDNNNNKTVCQINNYEWKNNPNKIEYKLEDNTEIFTEHIANIKEFQVANLKFKRFTVDIDRSGESVNNMSMDREPNFKEETLFLRYIIEGYASLFESPKHQKFFFTVNDTIVSQLIYKEYISENRVLKNNLYHSQLYEKLKCSDISVIDIKNTKYLKKDLIKLFEKYNTCKDSDFIFYKKDNKKDLFNLYIKPGFRIATLSIENNQNTSQSIDFGGNESFSFGLESEFVLPINKNKWALTIEPTYQYYKAKDPRPNYSNDVDYKSIELPIGLRYYLFLNEKSKLFFSLSFVLIDLPINSKIGYLEINTRNNLNFGFGYNYNNKFSAEFRYGSPREILSNHVYYKSKYQIFSLLIGYAIF